MPEPIKIRATLSGETTEIRMLLQHPMETGLRKDTATGETVPAHFIQTFSVTAKGKLLISGQLNTSIARNPLFTFQVMGLRAGDRVAVTWIDNKGEQRLDEAAIIAA